MVTIKLQMKASTNANCKFTIDQILEIRKLHGPKMGYRRLAKIYRVNNETIRNIVQYKTYKHIP